MRMRLLAGLTAALLAGGALLWALVDQPSGPSGTGAGELRTRFTSPHFIGYHEGVRQWSLRAAVVEEADGAEEGAFILYDISEGILFRKDRPDLRFRADRGVWRRADGDLELEGNVRFFEGDTEVLAAPRVLWRASEERLIASGRIRANYDGQIVEADFLDARIAEDTATLSGNVVWITPEGLEVRAERAEYAEDRLVFSGLLQPVRLRRVEEEPL